MERDYTKIELGMMVGMVVGAAIAVTMFALTGDGWWLAITGVGLAFGLGFGATWGEHES